MILRGIIGVIVGYIVMAIIVFGGLTAAYLALGADGAFEEGTYDVSMTWIAVWLIVSLVAAVLGGLVCRLIAIRMTAPMVFAAIVLVLGLLMAIPAMTISDEDKPGPRTADVGNMEAMTNAQSPIWVNFANPVIGAVGILIGAKLRGSAKATPDSSVV